MVTDGPVCPPWEPQRWHDPGLDPRAKAKAAKYQPWMFTDADIVVWLDGRVQTIKPGFVSWLVDCLGDSDMAVYRHPMRSSIIDEAEACVIENPHKYAAADQLGYAKQQLDGYTDDSLWQLTFFAVRRNERTERFGKRWQEEQDANPGILDQLMFPPLVAECGVKIADLPGQFWDRHGDLFVLRPHVDGT